MSLFYDEMQQAIVADLNYFSPIGKKKKKGENSIVIFFCHILQVEITF